MIKLQVIGHLGKDATVNTVNGKNVINFSVAHTEKYKDGQGNSQEKTTWVDCALWAKSANIAPYLTKGTQVFVEGSPEVRSFTRGNGEAGASLSVRVQDIQLLGGGNRNGGNASTTTNSQKSSAATDAAADDLPF